MALQPNDHGTITPDGYRLIYRPTHPLANRWGTVPEHRAVLYDAIGPEDHECHWCQCPLKWRNKQISHKTNADHVDGNRLNNVITNLVPACMDCNTRRGCNESGLLDLAAELVDVTDSAQIMMALAEHMNSSEFRRSSLMAFEAKGVAVQIQRIRRLRYESDNPA